MVLNHQLVTLQLLEWFDFCISMKHPKISNAFGCRKRTAVHLLLENVTFWHCPRSSKTFCDQRGLHRCSGSSGLVPCSWCNGMGQWDVGRPKLCAFGPWCSVSLVVFLMLVSCYCESKSDILISKRCTWYVFDVIELFYIYIYIHIQMVEWVWWVYVIMFWIRISQFLIIILIFLGMMLHPKILWKNLSTRCWSLEYNNGSSADHFISWTICHVIWWLNMAGWKSHSSNQECIQIWFMFHWKC